jgi:hypothetical protein
MLSLEAKEAVIRKPDIFAEKYNKINFRNFSENTRMDIKSVDLKA